MSILFKLLKNLTFDKRFRKISILVKIFKKSRFYRNCQKIKKILILVEISEKSRISQNCWNIPILVKSCNNLHLSQKFKNLEKSQCSQNFREILILLTIFDKFRF